MTFSNRRRFLRAVGAGSVAALAGCSGADTATPGDTAATEPATAPTSVEPSPVEERTPTATPTPRPTPRSSPPSVLWERSVDGRLATFRTVAPGTGLLLAEPEGTDGFDATAGTGHLLDLADGADRWSFEYDLSGFEVRSAGGRYVSLSTYYNEEDARSILYRIDLESESVAEQLREPKFFDSSPVRDGRLCLHPAGSGELYEYDLAAGERGWSASLADPEGGYPWLLPGERPAVYTTSGIIADQPDETARPGHVYLFDFETGDRLWRTELPGLPDVSVAHGTDGPAMYAHAGATHHRNGRLLPDAGVYRLDPADGSVRWRVDTEGAPVQMTATGRRVIQIEAFLEGGQAPRLRAHAADSGREQWRRSLAGERGNAYPLVVGDTLVVAGFETDTLAAYDVADGTERWRQPLAGSFPFPHRRTVFTVADAELSALSLSDGERRWSTTVGDGATRIVGVDGDRFYVRSGNTLYALGYQ